jgi:hypothetical protein
MLQSTARREGAPPRLRHYVRDRTWPRPSRLEPSDDDVTIAVTPRPGRRSGRL